MSDRAFVDTNILVYAHDSSAGAKNERARDFSNGQMYGSVRVVNPLAG